LLRILYDLVSSPQHFLQNNSDTEHPCQSLIIVEDNIMYVRKNDPIGHPESESDKKSNSDFQCC